MDFQNLISSKYIDEFIIGEELHHGCVQITPYRNKEYIKKFQKGFLLGADNNFAESSGYIDPEQNIKLNKFNIEKPGIVSQGYLFNVGFGLSVHDISFNAIANLSYKNLKYVEPVYEGDVLFGKSKVIGIEVKKDGASNGSVQVKTTITNQRDEVVIEYVRQVLLRATPGVKMNAISDLEVQPEDIDLDLIVMPKEFKNLNKDSLGNEGKAFEDFKVNEKYNGSFQKSINLVDFSWLQISTLNDASVHHNPNSNFIGYGGAIKSTVEGEISCHMPHAYFLGMLSGSHDAPTYPGNIIQSLFNSKNDDDEKIIGSFVVKEMIEVDGRDDLGVLKIELIGEKIVTEAGMKAFEKAGFKGVVNIKDGKIRVLTMEMLVAVPKQGAFK